MSEPTYGQTVKQTMDNMSKRKDDDLLRDQESRAAYERLAASPDVLVPPEGTTVNSMTNPNSPAMQAAMTPEQRAGVAMANVSNDPLAIGGNKVQPPAFAGFGGGGGANGAWNPQVGFNATANPNAPGINMEADANAKPEVFAQQPGAQGQPAPQQGGGGAFGGAGYKAYLDSIKAQGGPLGEAGDAAGRLAEGEGITSGLAAQQMGAYNEKNRAAAEAHDKAYVKAGESIDAASKEANASEDPNHFWSSASKGDHVRLVLAAALGGFLSGFRGGPNQGMEQINHLVDQDIASQRHKIEAARGRVADLRGGLADMYRRFGNMDQAEAGAQALHYKQLIAEGDEHDASARSDLVRAKWGSLRAELNTKLEEAKIKIASGGPKPMTEKERADIEKTRAETAHTNAETAKLNGGAASETPKDAPEMSYGQAVASLLPWTQSHVDAEQYGQRNALLTGAIHKKTGLRGEGAIHAAEPFTSSPWTPNSVVRQHNEAGRNLAGVPDLKLQDPSELGFDPDDGK